MTLVKLDPCCTCADHQRIFRNEDGWVLTQDFEAWTAEEWKRHCARNGTKLVAHEKRDEIVARLAAGEKPKDLAAEYGLNADTVRRYRRQFVEDAA